MLDGSILDSFVHIYAFSGSIASSNPTKGEIIRLVEDNAKDLFIRMDGYAKKKKLDHLDLMRFCCLSSIDGANGIVNLTDSRLVKSLDPKSYFPTMSIGLSNTPHKKPKFKIAYQILTHEIASFRNLELLVDKLDTTDSIILIHVDLKSVELKRLVEMMVRERSERKTRNKGFFELLGLLKIMWERGVIPTTYTLCKGWELKKSSLMKGYCKNSALFRRLRRRMR